MKAKKRLNKVESMLSNLIDGCTTERYLGCKQRLREAVNDHIGIEPPA
jgi:hypothetical protein